MSTKSITVSKPALITKDWQGKTFTFREDGYFNMTKAAQHFDKKLSNFWDSPNTKEAMDEFSKTLDFRELTIATRGRYNSGTWGHPKIAVFYAWWLDPRFAVHCSLMIDDILRGVSTVTIEKPAESSVVAAQKTTPVAAPQVLQQDTTQKLAGLVAQMFGVFKEELRKEILQDLRPALAECAISAAPTSRPVQQDLYGMVSHPFTNTKRPVPPQKRSEFMKAQDFSIMKGHKLFGSELSNFGYMVSVHCKFYGLTIWPGKEAGARVWPLEALETVWQKNHYA